MKTSSHTSRLALIVTFGLSAASALAEQEGDFTYSIESNAITITKYTGAAVAVTIPETIGKLPVRAIGDQAFAEKAALSSIVMPAKLTTIGSYTFRGCAGLTNLAIPASVTRIGVGAFYGCSGIKNVSVPASITTIEYDTFRECAGLVNVVMGDKVSSIGKWAFCGCKKLEKIILPGSITSLGGMAFYGCETLTNVAIPGKVAEIGDMAFAGCAGLLSIEVAKENRTYCAIGGILFSSDRARLLQCPAGKSGDYEIPAEVTYIGWEAFNLCARLTSVLVPAGVTEIKSPAFVDCRKLSNVIFVGEAPKGKRAFENPANDFTIRYYKGSKGFTTPNWDGYKAVELDPATELFSWIASDGRITKAKFVRLDQESVVIEKEDGKQFTLPFEKISSNSVGQAKRIAALMIQVGNGK